MKAKLQQRHKELHDVLIGRMNADGFWTGELSSSALAVAVSIVALHFDDEKRNRPEIDKGLHWLKQNINADGSYGDTPESPGNMSTSLLVAAALNLYVSDDILLRDLQSKINDYLAEAGIDIRSDQVITSILTHYKKDYTFSVPILTLCALCGLPNESAFEKVPQLPFELALLPRRFYRLLKLSVVSYAIPALVAVGIVIFKKKKSSRLMLWAHQLAIPKALRILENMLPESGGFLEAIPLTAFVSLSLIKAGYKEQKVVSEGIAFLKRTQRTDGGWPIDVDLSTWVTTLSIKALRDTNKRLLTKDQRDRLSSHLLSIQNKEVHAFNGTGAGAWGWTSYSGSVPDGDDTPGAILALLLLQGSDKVKEAILTATRWLLDLQNSDGGFPTFSKGWGKLPFDQSCSDLTGHCFLALSTCLNLYQNDMSRSERTPYINAIQKASNYLAKNQSDDGSWLPLWFGNQQTKNHENPVYGTARVVSYLKDVLSHEWINKSMKIKVEAMIKAGNAYLLKVQNTDGSWGGAEKTPGSMEETSLAISALAGVGEDDACLNGFHCLDKFYQRNGLKPAPIGLYFASLWYDEQMYPLTAYLEALSRYLEEQ